MSCRHLPRCPCSTAGGVHQRRRARICLRNCEGAVRQQRGASPPCGFALNARPRCLARGSPWPRCTCFPARAAAASLGPGHSAQGVASSNPTAASQGELPHHAYQRAAPPFSLLHRTRGRIQFQERGVDGRATRCAFRRFSFLFCEGTCLCC